MSKKVVFTKHARVRCEEHDLSFRKVKEDFKYAKIVNPPQDVHYINHLYHSKIAGKIQYRWKDGILYTVVVTNARLLVLTVTPKKDPRKTSKS